MRFSANLRIIYNLRSNSLLLVTSGTFTDEDLNHPRANSSCFFTNLCTINWYFAPTKNNLTLFAYNLFENAFCSLRRLSYLWANIIPTPYSPAAGKLIPSTSHSRLKNSCGICTKIPAPSPVSLSAPAPPRCSRRSKIRKPSSIISWDFYPLILTTKPMPHASFSN